MFDPYDIEHHRPTPRWKVWQPRYLVTVTTGGPLDCVFWRHTASGARRAARRQWARQMARQL